MLSFIVVATFSVPTVCGRVKPYNDLRCSHFPHVTNKLPYLEALALKGLSDS
jgi:hypothetical protein